MPWSAALALAVVLVGAGILLIVVGRRAAAGRLPRNWIVGIRTTKTLESDRAWDAAHHAAAGSFAVGGYVSLLGGLALLTRPANGVGLAITIVALVALLTVAIIGVRRGHRAIERL